MLTGSHAMVSNKLYQMTFTKESSIVDVDECTLETDQCEQNCINTVGSYTCSCNVGYFLSSNGFNCTSKLPYYYCEVAIHYLLLIADEDECFLGTNNCSQNCHDTLGSYTCSCRTGYQGDGFTCDG